MRRVLLLSSLGALRGALMGSAPAAIRARSARRGGCPRGPRRPLPEEGEESGMAAEGAGGTSLKLLAQSVNTQDTRARLKGVVRVYRELEGRGWAHLCA